MTQVAKKFDTGKPRLDLLPTRPLEEVGHVLAHGGQKYGEHNWRTGGGFKYGRLIAAALRHVFAFLRGENVDPETGRSHLAHAICCLLFLLEYVLMGTGIDDRHKEEGKNDNNNADKLLADFAADDAVSDGTISTRAGQIEFAARGDGEDEGGDPERG